MEILFFQIKILFLEKNSNFMKIKLTRINHAVQFKAANSQQNEIILDGSPSIGGINEGMRPMETLLSALAGCSAMDVVSLLKKMRQPLEDLTIEVDGTRDEKNIPAIFTHIHLKFNLTGNLDENKVKKAIGMSVDQYCSVARMLENKATIEWSYSIQSN
jgi:uncharacterized OsmC-like protein